MAAKPYIIALEEHYLDPQVKQHFTGMDVQSAPRLVERLDDVGELRLREMDEAGIDMQVLSHAAPAAAEDRMRRPRCGWRAAPMTGSIDGARASRPLRRLCRDPDARPESRRRRTRAHSDPARLQGRHDQRADQRGVSRRQAVLADFRAGRGARRAALHAPGDPASGGRRGLLQGLRRSSGPRCCAPPGASPWRPRPRAFAWC